MEIAKLLTLVREKKPLVHHITNMVTASECANITLLAGGLPIMAHALEEVEEMVGHAGALVLNIGTLSPAQVEAMLAAGRRANELGLPIILDPVGAGATALRTESAVRLLDQLQIGVIKGNAAEIAVLAGGRAEIRGVESLGVDGDVAALAVSLARRRRTVVAVTGAVDLVTDGRRLVEIGNGHPLMGKVVGTGCMSASLVGCFAAVEPDLLYATAAALVCFGVAAELAGEEGITLPTAFKERLFDQLYRLDVAVVDKRKNITQRVIE